MDIVIRKLEQIAPLSAEEKAALRSTFSTIRSVAAGEDLVRDGERPMFVGSLLEGILYRYKTLFGGARQIVAFVTPGDVFDLHSFTLKTMDHSAGAVTRAVVATATHSAVMTLTMTQPRLGLLLWRESIVEAAILREWVVNCGRRSAYGRIAHLLCELYTRFEAVGLVEEGGCRLPLTQANLSDATGLSVVHVNRVLQQLRSEELISLHAGRLTIHDREGLIDAAEFDKVYLHSGEPLTRLPTSPFSTFQAPKPEADDTPSRV